MVQLPGVTEDLAKQASIFLPILRSWNCVVLVPEKGEIEEAVIGSMDSSNLEFWVVWSEEKFWCRFKTLVLLAQFGKNRFEEPFHCRNSCKFFGRDWCM